MNKFEKGDEVYLSVGSCDMVVTATSGDSVYLAWMEGNDGPIHQAELPYWVLEHTRNKTDTEPTRAAHPSYLSRQFGKTDDDDIPF